MNSIRYEFTIYFKNSLSIHFVSPIINIDPYFFGNSLGIYYFSGIHYGFIIFRLIHYELIIFFSISVWNDSIFHELILSLLLFSWKNYEFTRSCMTKLWKHEIHYLFSWIHFQFHTFFQYEAKFIINSPTSLQIHF